MPPGRCTDTGLSHHPRSTATAAAATAIEILLDGQTPEKLDEQTLLDAGKRTAELNLESATKRATIRLHVLGAALDWLQAGHKTSAARLLGFDRGDEITILFCGTKKSLIQGVPMARVLFAGPDLGFILLPIMIFHQMQLMVCAVRKMP